MGRVDTDEKKHLSRSKKKSYLCIAFQEGSQGSRPAQRLVRLVRQVGRSREFSERSSSFLGLFTSNLNVMDIYIEKGCTTPRVFREIVLQFGQVTVMTLAVRVSVADFYVFLSGIYKIYARLSRESDRVTMMLPLKCMVGSRRFFVRVDGNALRYGER